MNQFIKLNNADNHGEIYLALKDIASFLPNTKGEDRRAWINYSYDNSDGFLVSQTVEELITLINRARHSTDTIVSLDD